MRHPIRGYPTMRRAILSTCLALLAALQAGPALAQRGDEFTFYGSGFGHGLGMSQWGAYGLARDGWNAGRILRHFYSGTTVDPADSPPARLRIGLTQERQVIQLDAESGEVDIRLRRPRGEVVATIPSGRTWRVRAAEGDYRVVDHTGATVARVGGTNTPIFAVYEPNGARVRIPEAGHTYNRGWIEFGLYNCSASCRIRLVLGVPPDEYLYGLSEVPSSWPMAALEAQAIAARTYALTKASNTQHRAVCDCALYASSLDQVYAGWDKEGGLDGDRWVRAVDNTSRLVVKDGGRSIQAFYMSSSGGFTEDNENVWGGSPISYLRGVCDPGDYTSANPSATWEVTYSASRVTKQLSLGIGRVTGFTNAERGVSGRIVTVTVRGSNGSRPLRGTALRSALGLRDDRVWINADRHITGAIRQKYDAIDCAPGLPRSRQLRVAGGMRQRFEDATIYFSRGTGAHELHGRVLTHYIGLGGPGGRLGFPVTDVRRKSNGNLRAGFEHGVITCSDTRCRVS
jgi:stage II sporulation protein D